MIFLENVIYMKMTTMLMAHTIPNNNKTKIGTGSDMCVQPLSFAPARINNSPRNISLSYYQGHYSWIYSFNGMGRPTKGTERELHTLYEKIKLEYFVHYWMNDREIKKEIKNWLIWGERISLSNYKRPTFEIQTCAHN